MKGYDVNTSTRSTKWILNAEALKHADFKERFGLFSVADLVRSAGVPRRTIHRLIKSKAIEPLFKSEGNQKMLFPITAIAVIANSDERKLNESCQTVNFHQRKVP